MIYIENAYICLTAPLLLAILCFKKIARRNLLFLLAGMTACLLSAYVSSFATSIVDTDYQTASHEIVPVVEECMKSLPLLFYLLVFEPEKKRVVTGALWIAVGFATFENICFLVVNGTTDLLRLLVRGFGAGSMHIVCGMMIAVGISFLWDQIWLRTTGAFALLCFVITFHAVFNVFMNQSGTVFWVGSAIPLTLVLGWMFFFHRQTDLF